ncbi:MAG: hypothetical protein JO105_19990 [Hyphomicrobiales bacterium]|nr:hypothetical protein [Hyphomicrobiales bacterium]MBV9977674.1 hypothetical protein [Hyphomicrobiales bacterium]
MAYAADKHDWFRAVGKTPTKSRPARHVGGFLRHMWDALASWASRGEDAEIAALLERSGGRLTDSIEREMLQRRSSNWTAFF